MLLNEYSATASDGLARLIRAHYLLYYQSINVKR